MYKTHWDPDETDPEVGCGRYKHMVGYTSFIQDVTCKSCQRAITKHLNKLMKEDEPQRFVRAGTSVCMRGQGDDKNLYVLFDAHPRWFAPDQDKGNRALFEQYADDMVEILNERWSS